MLAAVYFLGLAFLFTHELDGVTHAEWRLLFVLRDWPDAEASTWFVALHVPLFFAILWLSSHPEDRVRDTARAVMAGFLVVHAALHFALSGGAEYDFHGALSRMLIVSAGVCGLGYLAGRFRPGARSASDATR